jgi:cytidylate kinase
LAERLGYAYINTGSLYRALAYAAKGSGIAFSDINAEFLNSCHLEFRGADLYLNGQKLTEELRAPECAKGASVVSANPLVRDYLLPVQRNSACGQWIVMEGRDIGTVIFPDAEKKFFVTASPEERARRRMAQSSEVADGATFESILADIIARDERDSNRATAPLRQAEDAILVDTTGMTIDEVVEKIAGQCR